MAKARKAPLGRDAEQLLLYLETRAVDHGGIVDGRHMNKEDFRDHAPRLVAGGLIQFGRCPAATFVGQKGYRGTRSHWVRITIQGWAAVHDARRRRAERNMSDIVKEKTEPIETPNKAGEDSEGDTPVKGADDAQ